VIQKYLFFEEGVTVKHLTLIFLFMLIFLLRDVSTVAAQFFEARVQKLETPVEAPDFTLRDLRG
jgi:Na+-transporting methylmalonyl-CoA/oxaloacetate decarboxylase gamma subunit